MNNKEQVKWRLPALIREWETFLYVCLHDPEIGDSAYRTYHQYLYNSQLNGDNCPTINELSNIRGKGEKTIAGYIRELVGAGYITRERRVEGTYITWIEDIEQTPHLKEVAREYKENRDATKWDYPKTEFAKLALNVCGRNNFPSVDAKSRWEAIESAMRPLKLGGSVKFPKQWVEEMIDWAYNKNFQIRNLSFDSRRIEVSFVGLLSAIENTGNRDEWKSKVINDGTLEFSDEDLAADIYVGVDNYGELLPEFRGIYEER